MPAAWDQEMPILASSTLPTRDEVEPSEYDVLRVIEGSESMLISLSILY